MRLPSNSIVTTREAQPRHIRLIEHLSQGGQAHIYKAQDGSRTCVVKVYKEEEFKGREKAVQEKILLTLLDRLKREPELARDERFVWPEVLIQTPQKHLGYVMRLVDISQYTDINKYTYNHEVMQKTTLRARHRVAFELARSIRSLHLKGLVYADLSLKNVLFHPDNGNVCILDNDNVVPGDKLGFTVKGTPNCMAPELINGTVKAPSFFTDYHALAVLIFHMLFQGPPFIGLIADQYQARDLPFFRRMCGEIALFVWHPTNKSNRPDERFHLGPHYLWHIYPPFIKDLFIRTFVTNLKSPKKRPVPYEWQAALLQLDGMIINCSVCKQRALFFLKNHKDERPQICWNTQKEKHNLSAPLFRLEPIKRSNPEHFIAIEPQREYYSYNFGELDQYVWDKPMAKVITKKDKPNVFGLQNLTMQAWQVFMRNNNKYEISPGKAAPLNRAEWVQINGKRYWVKKWNEI